MGDPVIQSGLITQMPWAGAVAPGSEGCFGQEPWQTAAELCQADVNLEQLILYTDNEVELLRFIP